MNTYYCLITVSVPLTDDTIVDGVVTEEGTKTLAKNAIKDVGIIFSQYPNEVTQVRPSVDWQKFLVEITQETEPVKSDFTPDLSTYLQIDEQIIASAITLEVLGNDQNARDYLIANKAEWGE